MQAPPLSSLRVPSVGNATRVQPLADKLELSPPQRLALPPRAHGMGPPAGLRSQGSNVPSIPAGPLPSGVDASTPPPAQLLTSAAASANASPAQRATLHALQQQAQQQAQQQQALTHALQLKQQQQPPKAAALPAVLTKPASTPPPGDQTVLIQQLLAQVQHQQLLLEQAQHQAHQQQQQQQQKYSAPLPFLPPHQMQLAPPQVRHVLGSALGSARRILNVYLEIQSYTIA